MSRFNQSDQRKVFSKLPKSPYLGPRLTNSNTVGLASGVPESIIKPFLYLHRCWLRMLEMKPVCDNFGLLVTKI